MKARVRSVPETWPKRAAFFWESAPFFRPLLPLMLGIVAYDQRWVAWKSAVGLLVILLTCGAGMAVVAALPRLRRAAPVAAFVLSQAFFLTLGYSASFYHDDRNDPGHYARTMQHAGAYLARISGAPQEKQNIWKHEVTLLRATDSAGQRQWPVSGRAYLNIYKNDSTNLFGYGDTVVIRAAWQTINNTGNPFEFDYVRFMERRGIYHQIFVPASSGNVAGKASPGGLSWLERGHNWSVATLRRYLPDRASFGLLQAMLMGDERDFDPELRQAYSDTGVVHIVSISGSHTAMIFLVVTALFFWLRRPRWQWVKYVVGIGVVWVYVLMAGAPPSALRSAVMFSVFAMGLIIGRQRHPLNTLLMAAFALLLAEPNYLFAVGFQLSFTAVLSLILFYEPIARLWPWAYTLPYGRKVWKVMAGSLAAMVLTSPIVVFYFHNFPVLSPVANIASVVLIGGIALIGGLVILAFWWLPPLASLVGQAVAWCVGVFNHMILWMQEEATPQATRHIVLTWPEVLLLYGFILFAGVAWLRKRRRAMLPALGCLAAMLASRCVHEYGALRQERLIVYNTNKQLLIEQFSGDHFTTIANQNDSGRNKMIEQAHNGYYAWRERNGPHQYVAGEDTGHGGRGDAGQGGHVGQSLTFQGKNIALLRHYYDTATLPATAPDVLILSDSVQHYTLAQIRAHFRPGLLLIAGPQRRYLVKQWKDSARLLGQPLHATMLDGAWTME